ncbi:hypothetical protein D3H65_11935 [Paraflavitalea soli]|uniref:Uncharacterized protein n=1 Tax=Paraflavitalea soli TaxID=2315862 RepID=A0A3B7MLQ0_9BACT|nr:hypothetical protein D3H65_11935 [Paraflavitalea soli]
MESSRGIGVGAIAAINSYCYNKISLPFPGLFSVGKGSSYNLERAYLNEGSKLSFLFKKGNI